MVNTSPLEVHYKWYFLRRPPVPREDPEQMDEGVDMQSECETDSLTEAGGENGEEEGGQGEEEEEECEEEEEEEEQDGEGGGEDEEMGEGVGGEKAEEQEEEEEGKESGEEEGEEEEEGDGDVFEAASGRESEQSHLTESGVHARPVKEEEGESQGSKPDLSASQQIVSSTGFTGPEEGHRPQESSEAPESLAESYAPLDKPAGSVGVEAEEPQLPHAAGDGKKQQPWELVEDPFTPLSIEQV